MFRHVWPNDNPRRLTHVEFWSRIAVAPRRTRISFGVGGGGKLSAEELLEREEERARLLAYEVPEDAAGGDNATAAADEDEEWIPVLPGDDPDAPDFVARATRQRERRVTYLPPLEGFEEGEEFEVAG